MARAYNTSLGTVIVENLLDDNHQEVVYLGYLLDRHGEAIEHSHRQLQRHEKGTKAEMRELRRYCVKCVVSCYKCYLAQQPRNKKNKRVSFKSDLVQVRLFARDTKVSREEKVRQWDEFGVAMRNSGLCSPDTKEDLMYDALTCRMCR